MENDYTAYSKTPHKIYQKLQRRPRRAAFGKIHTFINDQIVMA